MRPLTVADAAILSGATLTGWGGAPVGPDVVIDSRTVTPGALFVAIRGEHADGHDYAASALERGAAAILAEHNTGVSLPHLIVEDSVAGLSRLAAGLVAQERERGLRTVGITGSSGKTSTKDLVAAVLEAAGPTISPVGSFNNEIGVPLTATQIDEGTRYLVSEMGARGIGHVAWLCSIVPPDVAVVVNVGHAHLGEFGSVSAVAQAKGELVEALTPQGWAVLNADDDQVAAMHARTLARVAWFSPTRVPEGGSLRVWASHAGGDDLQRYSFTLHAAGVVTGHEQVSLQVVGQHQVGNALAAACVGLVLGMDLPVIAAALSRATARSKWRMEIASNPSGVLIINDSYNANPDSMAAALRTLAGMRRHTGRLIAVLGDMRELGPFAAAAHAEVGTSAVRHGVDLVLAIGDHARDLMDAVHAAGGQGWIEKSPADAARHLLGSLRQADVVLVKASRGVALDTLAAALLAPAPTEGSGVTP